MTIRRALFAALGIVAVAAALAWAFAPRPVQVETAVVQAGRFEQSIEEDGRTRIRDRYTVSALLLGELGLVIAVALPLGMLLGWALVHAIAEALKSDQFFFPVVIRARTYSWAALCVVAAGLGSALVVRRRIDRLDLVAVLKTRD